MSFLVIVFGQIKKNTQTYNEMDNLLLKLYMYNLFSQMKLSYIAF